MRPKYQNIRIRRKKGKFQSSFSFRKLISYQKIIKILILFLLIILPIYYLINKGNLDIKKFTLLGKNINVLLIGVTPDEEQLSLLAVASINFKQQKYSILSILPDTKISTKELKDKTFSQIYQGGGVRLTTSSLESLLNERIPYHIITNRKSAQKIVDLLNGIEILIPEQVTFENKLTSEKVNIPSGWQRLDGGKASQYAYLSYEGEGKDKIIERQQKYLESLICKLFSRSSPVFISKSIVQRLKDNVCTNLTLKDINYFIGQLRKFNYKELRLATLIGWLDSSGKYFIPDTEKNKNLLSRLLKDKRISNLKAEKELKKETEVLPKVEKTEGAKIIKVRILNGWGRKGIANSLQEKLKADKNLKIIEVGNANNFKYKDTIIYDHVGIISNASYIKDKFLKRGIVKQEIDKTALSDITIIIGKDFKN